LVTMGERGKYGKAKVAKLKSQKKTVRRVELKSIIDRDGKARAQNTTSLEDRLGGGGGGFQKA